MNAPFKILSVLPETIPAELKALPSWIVWKGEERLLKDGSPKLAKIPYSCNAKRKASSTDPSTWGDFGEAFRTYESGDASGLGFVFTKKGGIVGIDLDGCFDGERVEPKALMIVEHLNSYTELSVSGTGLHILLKGVLPWNGKRRDPVEVYSEGRYFTMTGRIFRNYGEIIENQPALDRLLSILWPPERGSGKSIDKSPAPISDEELLRKASNARNGSKFSALWKGEWEALGFPSQSEADAALISLLWYWTGGDRNRSEEMFKRSGLNRPKFETRKDYRDRCFSLCERGAPR